jgi:tetratricopeptide (TPR) repeat protein
MAELALRTAETNPDAIGLRAHIHVSQYEFEQAETLLRFGIAHNPDEAMLHEGLARVSLARGRHEDALKSANTALRLEPSNPGAMAVRAAALEEVSDREAVLAALRQGVLLHPEDPYGMVELASMEMERGNLDRARSLLMRASRLAPSDREIGDVRVLVDHVHTHRLLRPVPKLLKWLREFPGGLPGFVIGLLIAGLPLHAVAVAFPQYRVPALTLAGVWAAVALYAWIAPARLTHRLNQRAARASRDRLERELHDPLAVVPRGERVTDVLAMTIDARERRAAVKLAATLADRFADEADAAVALRAFATEANSTTVRAGLSPLTLPALARALVAVAATLFVTAPSIASRIDHVDNNIVYAVGLIALTLAWASNHLEGRARLRTDEAIAQVRLFTK